MGPGTVPVLLASALKLTPFYYTPIIFEEARREQAGDKKQQGRNDKTCRWNETEVVEQEKEQKNARREERGKIF
jgi:hypothetical protein